ncbi:hypothetical protein [Streptosporangium sp. NPDC051022]|uniref:hypothetical protein n=1 Tax=Streptosporangium sp. NPDC051022 TaxID=3155752 RepID=UPI003445291E
MSQEDRKARGDRRTCAPHAVVRDELLSLRHDWRSHLWWFLAPHPAARRTKTEYHRRRR